jgi:hypothetical protein
MTDRRKRVLLVMLVGVWVFLIGVRLFANPEPQRVALLTPARRVAAAKNSPAMNALPAIVRAQHARTGISLRDPKNIFASLRLQSADNRSTYSRLMKKPEPPPPVIAPPPLSSLPPPPPAIDAPPPPSPEELAAQAARRLQELTTQQARQLLSQYRFLGYLAQGGEQRAFLGKGKDLYIVRHGETLEGKVLVKAIDGGFIQLMDAATRIENKIPLTQETGASLPAQ